MAESPVKYVFVTGGVVSGLGKGISAASLGTLLKARGIKVSLQKCDPYLNVDPGTMSPFQHGEVFVTEDGAETDLDLGHYERFTDESLTRISNVTTGADLRHRHQAGAPRRLPRGDGAGDPARHRRDQGAHQAGRRQLQRRGGHRRDRRHGRRHRVAPVPRGDPAAAQRRRPRARLLRPRHPGAVPRRLRRAQDEDHAALGQRAAAHRYRAGRPGPALQPAAHRRHPPEDRPLRRHPDQRGHLGRGRRRHLRGPAQPGGRGLREGGVHRLGRVAPPPDLTDWRRLVDAIGACEGRVRIALVGKYVQLHDAYLSVAEALKHAAIHHGVELEIDWVNAEAPDLEELLALADGILVPGGFGGRGVEGKIAATRFARERGVPFLGICLGMQIAVIEFARHVCAMDGANSSEFDPETPYPVIDLLPEQRAIEERGGTMRLGADPVHMVDGHAGAGRLRRPGRHLRAPPPPLRGQPGDARRDRARRPRRERPLAQRAPRRDRRAAGATPGSARPSSTPSSRAGPPGRSRSSASSSARPPVTRAPARRRRASGRRSEGEAGGSGRAARGGPADGAPLRDPLPVAGGGPRGGAGAHRAARAGRRGARGRRRRRAARRLRQHRRPLRPHRRGRRADHVRRPPGHRAGDRHDRGRAGRRAPHQRAPRDPGRRQQVGRRGGAPGDAAGRRRGAPPRRRRAGVHALRGDRPAGRRPLRPATAARPLRLRLRPHRARGGHRRHRAVAAPHPGDVRRPPRPRRHHARSRAAAPSSPRRRRSGGCRSGASTPRRPPTSARSRAAPPPT